MVQMRKMFKIFLFIGGVILIIAYSYFVPEFLMPGDLSDAHGDLECGDCHTPWGGASDSSCLECHEALDTLWHNETVDRTDCTSCHSEHRNRVTSGHFQTDCISCHVSPHDGEEFGEDCELCHSTGTWTVRDVDHGKFTQDCESCHDDAHPEQDLAGNSCLDCHDRSNVGRIDYTHASSGVERLISREDHREEDIGCYRCHDTKRFDDYNCLGSGCHGSSSEDRKHKEEDADDWRERDCFESGCHSDGGGGGDDDDDDDDDDDRGGRGVTTNSLWVPEDGGAGSVILILLTLFILASGSYDFYLRGRT